MKRIILAVCFTIFMVSTVEAQTIHWLTFIDTNDPNVGEIDILGRKVLYRHFIDEVNAALAPKGYSNDIQDFYGNATTPENCKAAVQLLRISNPDDIIVFYYIGHGCRPITDIEYIKQHPYPQMCMQVKFPEDKYIPLEWVDKELSNKGARLSVTIGMCCNSFSNTTIKEGPSFTPNYGASYMSGKKVAQIQHLFLSEKGNVLATSASPTQTSGCLKSDFGIIDAYTTVLCSIFKDSLDDLDGHLTWDLLLDSMSSIVNNVTMGTQTPFHKTHLAQANQPKQVSPKPVSPKSTNNRDDILKALSHNLGTLINVNLSESERIQLSKKLEDLFTSNSIVRILGQDTDTAIDKENASVFLGRLATSRLLLNVSIVDCTFEEDNRISSMKVREIYER